MPGKVSAELLEYVFDRTGADDPAVFQGPADGEDAAAIDFGDETLVVSSDPISLAASEVGRLGVDVACNDVAASGADPRWLTVVVMLPGGADDSVLEEIAGDLDDAARGVGAAIVGGHSEYVDALERPLLSLTAMGSTDRFVPTGGAEPGDRIVLTKAAAIEGTAILAADFGEELGVPQDVRERALGFFEEVSVVPDGRVLREYATAMHDPTEGGLLAGLAEVGRASGVRLEIERDAVPVREETRTLCEAAGVDPLRIFGSGALLATVPEDDREDALAELAEAGIGAAEIGVVREGSGVAVSGEPVGTPIEDDLYPLWERADR